MGAAQEANMCKCCSGGKNASKYKKFAFLNSNHDHDHGHDEQDHDHPDEKASDRVKENLASPSEHVSTDQK